MDEHFAKLQELHFIKKDKCTRQIWMFFSSVFCRALQRNCFIKIVSPCTLWAENHGCACVDHCFLWVSAGTTEDFFSSVYYPQYNCLGCSGVEVHWHSWWLAWWISPQSTIMFSCSSSSVIVRLCPAVQPEVKCIKTEIHVIWWLLWVRICRSLPHAQSFLFTSETFWFSFCRSAALLIWKEKKWWILKLCS